MTLSDLVDWVRGVPESLPEEMRPMAESICEAFESTAKRLMDLGLGYLTLDRSASTLSTGERQRMQLARAVRNRTTGVLYVLDEPSIGLHPLDVQVLLGVFQALLDNGATVVVIEHDLDVIRNADYIIDMGPGGGEAGGRTHDQQARRHHDAHLTARAAHSLQDGTWYGPQEQVLDNGRIHTGHDRGDKNFGHRRE